MANVRYPRSSVFGAESVRVTVSLPSSVVPFSTLVKVESADSCFTDASGLPSRPDTLFTEYTTSSALSSVPLWNFTPCLITKV